MQKLDYKIVAVGEISSGKSSFINSLLGKYVCPTSILRKTVTKSSHNLTRINPEDGKTEVVELVDYPGFNDANQNTFLQEFLRDLSVYDHILWITTSEKCLMNDTEKKTFYSICHEVSLISKLINVTIIVNKSDMNDAKQNTFRLEKNEYEILYDNMCSDLEKDYPFVEVFKHSSYCTFLDKIQNTVFELESQYVDEFNRTIRAKHGPQTYNFRKGDMINYSELVDSDSLQNKGISIPNLVEPQLFRLAKINRLKCFEKSLESKIALTIGQELEFIYDVLIHEFNNVNVGFLKTISDRMISMKLETRNQNDDISEYLSENGLNFSNILEKVLNRQNNQIYFLNLLAGLMGEVLYDIVELSLFKRLNFRNSGKSEFLYFLLQMDQMTSSKYDERDYFGILDTIKTESKEVYFGKFDPKSGVIVPRGISRFIIGGGELRLNPLLWDKLLRIEGRFGIVKVLMNTVANNSLILTNTKRDSHMSNSLTRLEMAQKKLNWRKHKDALDKLPKFLYDNLKFWYFHLLQVYLPNLFNPKFLDYPIDLDTNDKDSVLPNFSEFYDKSK